jgi:hypothetical protein
MSTVTKSLNDRIDDLVGIGLDKQELQIVLQRLLSDELNRIEQQFRDADDTGTNVDLQAVRALLDADSLDGFLKELGNQASGLKQLINEKLTEQFGLLGLQSTNIDNKTIYRNVDKYANAKPECRTALVEWARENELEDMIVVQPQKFKSWCKEQIEAGTFPEEIADMVDIFEKPSLRIRRA